MSLQLPTSWRSLHPDLRVEVAAVADHHAALHGEEQALVSQAVASRRQEFSSGRLLAHQLLQAADRDVPALLALEDRSPAWPDGILGSISHSRRWCAAAIAPQQRGLLGVGIDVEDARPFASDLEEVILTARERAWLTQSQADGPSLALSAFSIKEAVYKAVHPCGNVGLGFHAMELDFREDPQRPQLLPSADLLRRLPEATLPQVHHLRQNDVLLSLVLIADRLASSA
ncbi:MAG: 4'-phosphopantetheinyl transferase family protein [Planctomycetota bacterium]